MPKAGGEGRLIRSGCQFFSVNNPAMADFRLLMGSH